MANGYFVDNVNKRYIYGVPYIIAGTKEDATLHKNWWVKETNSENIEGAICNLKLKELTRDQKLLISFLKKNIDKILEYSSENYASETSLVKLVKLVKKM